jgi:hypothetical protein
LDPPENRQTQVKNARGRILKRRAEEIVKFRQEDEFLKEVVEPLNPTLQVQEEDPLEVEQELNNEPGENAPEFDSERHSEPLILDSSHRRTRRASLIAEQEELEQIAIFWETGVWPEMDA